VLRQLARLTEGDLPLIGVGGIGSTEQALEKIRAGAWAVQLYTAMVFEGVSLPGRIAQDLHACAQQNGSRPLSCLRGSAL
jgi:dihydroorotate dehydrogenase